MTLSCSSTDFENDSDFRPSRARCCLRFRLCRSIRCVYRLLITCSFPFRRDSYSGQPSVIHITTSKGDSRLIRRPSVAIVRSPNTCATTVFPEPVIRVKQPALARFSPDIAPLFVHFRADDDVTARLYARGYRLRPEFFKWRKIVLRPTPIMRAVARHPTPFMAISMIFWCVPGWEAV